MMRWLGQMLPCISSSPSQSSFGPYRKWPGNPLLGASSVIDWSYVHGIIFWALYPVPLIYFYVFVIYISVFVPVPYLVTKFFLGWSTLLLLNQIWVCLPACGKTNLLTPGCGKGENTIDCKVPDRAIRGVSAQNIQISPVGFRETFLQEKLVERAARCVILL